MTDYNKLPDMLQSMREARSFQPRLFSGTTDINSEEVVEFVPAFPSTPAVGVLPKWDGGMMVTAAVTAISSTGCTVKTLKSLNVIGLGLSVFEDAPETDYSLLVFEAAP